MLKFRVNYKPLSIPITCTIVTNLNEPAACNDMASLLALAIANRQQMMTLDCFGQ